MYPIFLSNKYFRICMLIDFFEYSRNAAVEISNPLSDRNKQKRCDLDILYTTVDVIYVLYYF